MMDQIASRLGKLPWPDFPEVRLARVADGFGCPADTVTTLDSLVDVLDRIIPTLRTRREPLLLNVEVSGEVAPR